MQKRPKVAPPKETLVYPMRINRYLAKQGFCTRREADALIEKKIVFINGALARLGEKVNKDDEVEVRQKGPVKTYQYFAYHKPRGVITHSPQKGEKDIRTVSKLTDVFPVGRLDKDSHGLIILSNDGRITDRLLNENYEHEKEYIVRTREKLRNNFKKKMEAGVDIEGYTTKKCSVRIIDEHTFSITLTEGKKHQIRRMVAAIFNETQDLKRVRIMNIELGKLPENGSRKIEGEELKTFLKQLGM